MDDMLTSDIYSHREDKSDREWSYTEDGNDLSTLTIAPTPDSSSGYITPTHADRPKVQRTLAYYTMEETPSYPHV